MGGMERVTEQCVFITSDALLDAAENSARTHDFALTARMEIAHLTGDRDAYRVALRERLATRALIRQLAVSRSLRHSPT